VWWNTRAERPIRRETTAVLGMWRQQQRHAYLFKEDLQDYQSLGGGVRMRHYPPYFSAQSIEHRVFPHIHSACQGASSTTGTSRGNSLTTKTRAACA